MVSIPSCHDGYPGSIPGRRAPPFLHMMSGMIGYVMMS